MPLTFRVSTQRYEIIAIMCLVPLDFVVVFFVLHSLWYYWCFFIVFFFFPSFLPSESSSENSLRTCLVVTNSFKFYLSGKLLICPSLLNDGRAG